MADQIHPTVIETKDGADVILTPTGGLSRRELFACHLVAAHLVSELYLRRAHDRDCCCRLIDHCWEIAGMMAAKMTPP